MTSRTITSSTRVSDAVRIEWDTDAETTRVTEVRVLTDDSPRIVVQPEASAYMQPVETYRGPPGPSVTVDVPFGGATGPLPSEPPPHILPVEELFLTYLKEAEERGVKVSAHKQSPNYAPKLLSKGQPVRASTLEHAMRRLLNSGRLVEVKYGRAARPFKRLVAADRAHLAEDAFE